MTCKLGSLLGEEEDVPRHKQLANVAFRNLWTVRFKRSHFSLQLRLRLYESVALPVLTYNMGTWGLIQTELDRLDAYPRRYLRQIIGIHCPYRISNNVLYHRYRYNPISEAVQSARWRLFGLYLSRELFRRHWRHRFQRSTAYNATDGDKSRPATHRTHAAVICRRRRSASARP